MPKHFHPCLHSIPGTRHSGTSDHHPAHVTVPAASHQATGRRGHSHSAASTAPPFPVSGARPVALAPVTPACDIWLPLSLAVTKAADKDPSAGLLIRFPRRHPSASPLIHFSVPSFTVNTFSGPRDPALFRSSCAHSDTREAGPVSSELEPSPGGS